jgi:quercetin dioxygenase-like cupin family protein
MKIFVPSLLIVIAACVSAVAQTPAPNPLAKSRTFHFEQMKPTANPNGSESRFFFSGTLATGESVNVHESVQPAGTVPPAPHTIHHSEFIVIQEGTVEYHHDGVAERAGPGSILYVKIGTEHFVSNIGNRPAKYAVIAIGGDVKE